MINSTDYFLYLPLMPQVAGGLVEPRHICVSLPLAGPLPALLLPLAARPYPMYRAVMAEHSIL